MIVQEIGKRLLSDEKCGMVPMEPPARFRQRFRNFSQPGKPGIFASALSHERVGIKELQVRRWSGIRESNPRLDLGKVAYYHYTNPALTKAFIACAAKSGKAQRPASVRSNTAPILRKEEVLSEARALRPYAARTRLAFAFRSTKKRVLSRSHVMAVAEHHLKCVEDGHFQLCARVVEPTARAEKARSIPNASHVE